MIPDHVAPGPRALLQKVLNPDASRRPTMQQILHDCWLCMGPTDAFIMRQNLHHQKVNSGSDSEYDHNIINSIARLG